jgi:hypothetical protein
MKFKFGEFIKSWDQFGKSVGLTIAGDDKFRTVHGGIVSMVYLSYIIYWAFINFVPVIQQSVVNTKTQVIFNDVNSY